MVKEQYRIGIIDDDSSKTTQMIQMIRLCCADESGRSLMEKYENYELIPVELTLETEIDNMIEHIIEKRLAISYTGVSLAKGIHVRLMGFPIFVLTTYRDDLFDHELFDAYLVFDFARYIGEDKERVEINSKLIEQIKKYRTEIENWKNELESLLPHAGESATIDERILELDSWLERSIDGRTAISLPVKRDFTAEKINELISKIDSLIEGD